ncbi:hypothetical protein ABT336_13690 [Micromonospora sp. NPDC000207]|uniref:hypothetical protein n=1 Tax=Micromonospora sp. NPDC000207 TaxID=3154246 RepID=UPI00331E0322
MTALLAPVLLGVAGVALAALGPATARPLPRPWRGTVTTATLGSALLLLTSPLLGGSALRALPVLWWVLLASTTCRLARDRRRGHPGPTPPGDPHPPAR